MTQDLAPRYALWVYHPDDPDDDPTPLSVSSAHDTDGYVWQKGYVPHDFHTIADAQRALLQVFWTPEQRRYGAKITLWPGNAIVAWERPARPAAQERQHAEPPYDEVFAQGTAWLDAGGGDEGEGGGGLLDELPGTAPSAAQIKDAVERAEAILGWLSVVTLPPAHLTLQSQPVLPQVVAYVEAQAQLPAEIRACLSACYARRIELGVKKYGVPLHSHRTRPPRLEALQEAFDGLGYETAYLMELEAVDLGTLDGDTRAYMVEEIEAARDRRDACLHNVVSGVGSILRAYQRRELGLPVPVPEWVGGLDQPPPSNEGDNGDKLDDKLDDGQGQGG